MSDIRPISDLRNHLTEIIQEVQSSKEPVLLTKQVAVRSRTGQRQHQHIVFNAVDQKPIRENMALTMAGPIPGQTMVFVFSPAVLRRETECG